MEQMSRPEAVINNDFYETLHDLWYTSQDHPIALLRAENAIRAPWVASEIAKQIGDRSRILDVGCGGGLLSNFLALEGHDVTGIDISQSSLEVAARFDASKKVRYLHANAYDLPFEKGSFDVVCAMDILEHVENPKLLVQQASKALRPGGLFFFHTFNRNLLSYFLIIKGVDWFVKNAPKNMHVYNLFIKPEEMRSICQNEGLAIERMIGLVPRIWHPSVLTLLFRGKVAADFTFNFSKSLRTGYTGVAVRI
jgi:2-polyprenyl-6-hydroxyphenyl methylase/3-demethylubiquinone-9 3-methyltransferase